MEKFKLDNFKTTYHKSMPVEKSLSKNESEAISTSLFQKLNLKKTDYFQEKESGNFTIIGHLNAGTYYINWDEVFQKWNCLYPMRFISMSITLKISTSCCLTISRNILPIYGIPQLTI